jgi:hypothetical protein
MYGGDAAANRRMLMDSTGNLWTNTYGWLHTYFALKSEIPSQSYNGVGSYLLAGYVSASTNVAGNTAAGSSLRQANTYNNGGDAGWRNQSASGTWRFMGAIGHYYNGSSYATSTSRNTQTTLFVRIS